MAIFFQYACNGKKIEKLFTSKLNKIAASVRYVSSTPVVLNVKFTISCGRQKEDNEKRKDPKKVTFLRGGTLTLNSCSSLEYARSNEAIIYFNDLCKPIELYIYVRKKHTFTSYPAAKHPKHSKFTITNMQKSW